MDIYDLMIKIDPIEELNLENLELYDYLSMDWSTFIFKENVTNYMISKEDLKAPYRIAYHFYNNTDLQDIIFLLNNIGDILSTPEGTIIKIPSFSEIKDFIYNNRVNR